MQDLPHRYRATACANATDNVVIAGEDLPQIISAPPEQFGGPGTQWSPEELLSAAVADCFVLTFRAIARASKLDWTRLEASAEGTLERVDRGMRFTAFHVTASLTVPAGTDTDRAMRLLEKAEAGCLITNSLACESHLQAEVLED